MPRKRLCFYGANTTNEWVVREYIKDKENNPTIYNGLPLHTEYRVFVDFDTKEILGASPYWRSDVMKNEFKKVSSPQERHDYVVYKMHEDILNQRYHESVQTVLAELKKVIPRIELTGQWSVDLTPPTIEIVGFLGGAARFIAKPCLKQRVMRFPIIRYRRSA